MNNNSGVETRTLIMRKSRYMSENIMLETTDSITISLILKKQSRNIATKLAYILQSLSLHVMEVLMGDERANLRI